jgi:hypothetical protein
MSRACNQLNFVGNHQALTGRYLYHPISITRTANHDHIDRFMRPTVNFRIEMQVWQLWKESKDQTKGPPIIITIHHHHHQFNIVAKCSRGGIGALRGWYSADNSRCAIASAHGQAHYPEE